MVVPAVVFGWTGSVAAAPVRAGVIAWGDNFFRQLGDESVTAPNRPTPGPVLGLPADVTQLAAGVGHVLALTSDHRVFAWGLNDVGQLGDGTTSFPVDSRPRPQLVPGLSNVVQVAAGGISSFALKSDGTVWAWGGGIFGQLGNGGQENVPFPVPVSGLAGVKRIAVGALNGYALLADGTVRAWGNNDFGAVGDGTREERLTPVPVSGLSGVTDIVASNGNISIEHLGNAWALLSDGTVRGWGSNGGGLLGDGTFTTRLSPVAVPGLSGARQIAAGFSHAAAVFSDGTVRTWGGNSVGQLGDGSPDTALRNAPGPALALPPVKQVAAGADHTMALLTDGTVRAWGRNIAGNLGDGTFTTRFTPVQVVGADHVTAIETRDDFSAALFSPPDYLISVNPGSGSVTRGRSVTAQVSLTPINGYTGSAALSAEKLPAGVSVSFKKGAVNPTTPAVMTVTASANSPTGTFTIVVTATDATLGVTRIAKYQLTIGVGLPT